MRVRRERGNDDEKVTRRKQGKEVVDDEANVTTVDKAVTRPKRKSKTKTTLNITKNCDSEIYMFLG
jgi:hypothetical protein